MSKVKFDKDSLQHKAVVWVNWFLQNFYETEDSDEYWERVIEYINKFVDGCEADAEVKYLAESLSLAVAEFLETKHRSKVSGTPMSEYQHGSIKMGQGKKIKFEVVGNE